MLELALMIGDEAALHQAHRFARATLIHPADLAELADRDENTLARRFGVPAHQIRRARRELHDATRSAR